MSQYTHFNEILNEWPVKRVHKLINSRTEDDVERAINSAGHMNAENLAALLSPLAEQTLEPMAAVSAHWTRQRFGQAVQFFAPLYVSNFCCNGCRYCGFNTTTNNTVRNALSVDQAVTECEYLAEQGFKNILLVSGEDRKNTPPEYFVELAKRIRHLFSSIQVEIYALSTDEYKLLVAGGVDGVTMFQETYNREVYSDVHPYGPKANYDNRIDAVERAATGGMTFVGLGALLGINDWREECFYLGLHADYVQKKYWRSCVSLSFPRMRPAFGGDPAPFPVSDVNLVQLMCALRLNLPDATMVLSTREIPGFREKMVKIAVTKISAGAKTTPGGYSTATDAEAQFEVADQRPLSEVAASIAKNGFDPVMKDWDRSYDS
jgi:2-iminoacetate synthase